MSLGPSEESRATVREKGRQDEPLFKESALPGERVKACNEESVMIREDTESSRFQHFSATFSCYPLQRKDKKIRAFRGGDTGTGSRHRGGKAWRTWKREKKEER